MGRQVSEEDGELASGKGGAPSAPHFWEHVLGPEPVSPHVRKGFKYTGLWRRHSALPLLLAGAEGHDSKGRAFRWVARRQRKRVLQPQLHLRPLPTLDWLGWLDARRHWKKLGWWIALLYTLGSILFCISGVAGEIQSVVNNNNGVRSLFAALITWPNMIAANLCFFPAGLIQMVESANMDFDSRLASWQVDKCRGPRPSHRLLPGRSDLRIVSWWASFIQLTGMLGFNLATIFSFISTVVPLKESTSNWTINFGFTYGGAGFTVSALLFALEATGSLWRGLVPTRLSDLQSISWHAAFWNFHGSVGFLIGGAATYATSFSWLQLQFINGYGNMGGAFWFLLSALFAFLEQANPGRQ